MAFWLDEMSYLSHVLVVFHPLENSKSGPQNRKVSLCNLHNDEASFFPASRLKFELR